MFPSSPSSFLKPLRPLQEVQESSSWELLTSPTSGEITSVTSDVLLVVT